MDAPVAAFTPTARSRVKRLPKRGHYDRQTVHSILDAGLVCHVGYIIDGQPYVTPTGYWREGDSLYWHGSSASRMLRSQTAGLPVCLTVTHLDGLVMARAAFHQSMNYRSVMCFGTARKVEDAADKLAALQAFVERVAPGRWETLRPVTAQEVKATTVMTMQIEEASAKIRTGSPIDDEPDYALPIWAGVVTVRNLVGQLIDDPRLPPGTQPAEHLARFAPGSRFDELLARGYDGMAALAEA